MCNITFYSEHADWLIYNLYLSDMPVTFDLQQRHPVVGSSSRNQQQFEVITEPTLQHEGVILVPLTRTEAAAVSGC